MTEWKKSRVALIDGLALEITKAGSYTYARVMHIASGLTVRSFTGHPLEVSQKIFASRVVAALSGVDWTADAAALANGETARIVSSMGCVNRA